MTTSGVTGSEQGRQSLRDALRGGSDGWTPARILSIAFLVLLTEQATFAFQIVTVALPDIATQFATTQISWVSVLTGLAGGILAPLFGKAADIRGKKRMIMVATCIGVVGSLMSALAPSFTVLLIGRVLQGATFAIPALAFSLVRDIFPRRIMALAASLVVTGVGVITIAQPFLSGALVDAFGFRGVFWFLAIYSIVTGLGVALFTPESPVRVQMRLDWAGAALLGAAVGLLLLSLSMGPAWGWTSTGTLGAAIAGLLALAGWIAVDQRVKEPLVDLRLLRSRPVATTILAGGLFYGAAGGAATVVPLLALQPRSVDGAVGLGTTALGAAVYFLPLGIGTVLIGFLVGARIRVTGSRVPAIIGCAVAALGLVGLTVWHESSLHILAGMTLLGIGQGFFYAAMPNLLIGAAPLKQQAVTASMMQCFQALMPTLVVQIVFLVLVANLAPGAVAGAAFTDTGYTVAFAVMAVVMFLTLCAALLVPHGRRDSAPPEQPAEVEELAAPVEAV